MFKNRHKAKNCYLWSSANKFSVIVSHILSSLLASKTSKIFGHSKINTGIRSGETIRLDWPVSTSEAMFLTAFLFFMSSLTRSSGLEVTDLVDFSFEDDIKFPNVFIRSDILLISTKVVFKVD